jgi:hypothetical protein
MLSINAQPVTPDTRQILEYIDTILFTNKDSLYIMRVYF